jgi:hypothetical protein
MTEKTQANAGHAHARAQLAAMSHALAMHPVSQASQEYPAVSIGVKAGEAKRSHLVL